ncbi:MAG: hypothetical protein ABSG83_11800 [Roseiarcus sp.]|jgi:hypothetical protein
MERSDAVTVILARIMKMMSLLGETPLEGVGSLEESGRLGEPIPIPLRAGRAAGASMQDRIAIGRNERHGGARRSASRR